MIRFFRFPMWGPRRPWRFAPKTRRELVISEAASQTCYSAAEIIRASANPDVETQLKILGHVLFEEWSAYRKSPVFWPIDDNQAEGILVRELLRLCQLIHWFQEAGSGHDAKLHHRT